jgi:GNAT superfamily N-acetyltransferase
MESVRRATSYDVPTLLGLAHALHAELRPQRGGEWWFDTALPYEVSIHAYESLVASPHHCVLVGMIDDAIIGFGVCERQTTRAGSHRAVIHELYVEPDARAIGVGELMLDEITSWAIEMQCRGIDAIALPGARETKNFFETAGMTARMLVVHRDLP